MKKLLLILLITINSLCLKSQTVHLVSALGADSTIFSNLTIDKSFPVNHAEWIKPKKRESLSAYGKRFVDENQIAVGDIVIGVSFGGILASEIGQQVNLQKIILISSISFGKEKPPRFKFLKIFRFTKLIPKRTLHNPNIIIKNCFGKVSEAEHTFLSRMIENSDTDLICWSLNSIMIFSNKEGPKNLWKINGTDDKTFPIKNIDTDFLLDGTHLIVYNEAEKVSALINLILRQEGEAISEMIDNSFEMVQLTSF